MAKATRKNKVVLDTALFQAESFLISAWNDAAQSQPTLFHSQDNPSNHLFIAVDEVGRGCLAGPLVVCATIWKFQKASAEFEEWLRSLRDSKKMSAPARERAFDKAQSQKFFAHGSDWETPPDPNLIDKIKTTSRPDKNLFLPIQRTQWSAAKLTEQLARIEQPHASQQSFALQSAHIGWSSAQEIDQLGIIPSLGNAVSRALDQLPIEVQPAILFFDGHTPLSLTHRWQQTPQILVTKGDDLLKSISTSSVLAKVVRDRWMSKYANAFPGYFFDEHCGYGTEKHRKAIQKQGVTPLHRRSFLRNICPES